MVNLFKKKSLPKEDQWLIAKSQEAGFPLLLRMRQQIPPGIHPQKYPILINIYWRYEDTSNSGLPTHDILERMRNLEERLDRIEGPDNGFLVLSITGNQRKEWIWYVSDKKAFVGKLNQALGELEPFPIEIQASDDPQWQNFTNLLSKIRKQKR
jgi:hypothetical protein